MAGRNRWRERELTNMRNDRQIQIFILTLLGIPGVASKTVLDILRSHKAKIETAEYLDEAFAHALQNRRIENGLQKPDVIWDLLEEKADEILESANRCDATVLQPYAPDYPQRLLLNQKYPPVLFAKGDNRALNTEKAVAIIGTREPTPFGAKMGRRLAQILAEDGYAIISGLALGCDSVAHEGALDVEGGRTVAVLPTPIDAPVYPRQNKELAQRILDKGGVLLTEYAPGVKLHDKQLVSNLVARDEWQPGLSDGVIAIETSTTGGTNHALNHAIRTNTPIAVFDYSSRDAMRFFEDERFSGNVERLQQGATGIFEPESIERFKSKMEEYRLRTNKLTGDQSEDGGQLPLSFV